MSYTVQQLIDKLMKVENKDQYVQIIDKWAKESSSNLRPYGHTDDIIVSQWEDVLNLINEPRMPF